MPAMGERKQAGIVLRSLVLLLLPLGLMLSGCMIRLSVETQVNEDESGTFALFIGFDEEFRQLIEQGGEQLDMTEGLGDVPAGWTVEDAIEGEFEGVRIATDFADFEELEQKLGELGEDEANGTNVVQDFSLARDGNKFRFEADTSGVDEELIGAVGGSGGDDLLSGMDPETLFDVFEIQYLLTLPGAVESHNADAVEGNTLLWTVRFDDERSTYQATSVVGFFLLRYVEEIELSVEIADDESGNLTLVLGLDEAVEELVDNGNEVASSFVEEVPGGWDVADLGENGLGGLSFSTAFSSLDRAERLLTRLGEATGLDAATGLVSNFELAQDGSDYRFQAEVSGGNEAASLDDGTAASLVLVLPGEIGDHNADEIDGTALVWDLGAAAAGELLEADSSTGGSTALLLAIIGLVVVAGIVGLAVLLQRRTTPAPPPAQTVESQSFCRACGTELPAAGRFCPACGAST